MSVQVGFVHGRHYSTYVEDVKALKRTGTDSEVERLLLLLIEATEAESQTHGTGVAPWYYEELAKLYRKHKDYGHEVATLERFAEQRQAPGVMPSLLLQRLEKARALLAGNAE